MKLGGLLAAFVGVLAQSASAQRPLDATPNTRAPWSSERGQPMLVISHRFERIDGGDELLNVPLITIGTALSERVAIGLDFTSNSEVTVERLGGNERQWWLAFRGPSHRGVGLSALVAYNSAASSLDAATTVVAQMGTLRMVAEARGFRNAFGAGHAGVAATAGASLALSEHLSLVGDVGQAFRPDSLGVVWTAGLTLALPGTRHQFAFHATNGGAPTLQGVSRQKVIGPESIRFGFAFVAPLGSAAQWRRVFTGDDRDGRAADGTVGDTIRISIRDLEFRTDTVHIRAGQWVEWVNADPVPHTVAARDGAWKSGFLMDGQRYARQFTAPGRFEYFCEPHPHMRGIVIVTP